MKGGGGRGATTPTTSDGEMYPMTDTLTEPIIMPATQSLQEYVAASGKHIRTVKQWLAEGLLPGAFQDEHGRWRIPVGAVRTAPQQQTLARKPEPQTVQQQPPAPVGISWDQYPTMLTLKQAEFLIGVPWRTIAAHGDYFDVIELDRKRVPLATVKRLRGVAG